MDKHKNRIVHIVNAFTSNGAGGNPAGIILDADNLSPAEKQAMAATVGLSETAFVSRSDVAGFKLDFFTPTRQIAHCGHATIATFSFLYQQGLVSGGRTSKETIDGIREIELRENGMAFMEQSAPIFSTITEADEQVEILYSLGISETDLLPGAPIMQVNTGNSFLIIPLEDTQVLANLSPNLEAINRISEARDLIGYYAFTQEAGTGFDATTRMFAPRYGIEEESATGMAAGPLGCYLFEIMETNNPTYHIQQGRFMQPAALSSLQVELTINDGRISGLWAGGNGAMVGEKQVSVG